MNKSEFLKVMGFPPEWEAYGMYPDELFMRQLALYVPGDEAGSEHDRNGAFHWWLKKNPSKDELMKLVELSFLDPDPLMAGDVRGYIRKAVSFDGDVEAMIERLHRPFQKYGNTRF